jgi:hypothetical protein
VARREAREEAAFLRGDVGVDGQATDREERDEAEVERGKAREQLIRNRAWLGREFLTWLLWRSEAGEPLVELEGTGVTVLFISKLLLRGVQGDVVEVAARGAQAPYSAQVKHALDEGLLVHQARLRFSHGERAYEATLDAEFLDVRSAKLPELLTEEEDDRLQERLHLVEQLSAVVDALAGDFLEVRAGRGWAKKTVPALKAWMRG